MSRGKAFRAKYPGRCETCREPIAEGDMVLITDDDTLVHANREDCLDESHLPVCGGREIPTCATCWTQHRGECA